EDGEENSQPGAELSKSGTPIGRKTTGGEGCAATQTGRARHESKLRPTSLPPERPGWVRIGPHSECDPILARRPPGGGLLFHRSAHGLAWVLPGATGQAAVRLRKQGLGAERHVDIGNVMGVVGTTGSAPESKTHFIRLHARYRRAQGHEGCPWGHGSGWVG